MTLKNITFSGIDETVDISWLVAQTMVQKNNHNLDIEFGILLSPNHSREKYPSPQYLEKLYNSSYILNLSGHLCGQFARDFADGKEIPINFSPYKRIQLNLASFIDDVKAELLLKSLITIKKLNKKCIIQVGNPHTKSMYLLNNLLKEKAEFQVLFDASGGNGIEPETWPRKFEAVECGYAGGLNPQNLFKNLIKIKEATDNQPFWIDMESGIRTNYRIDKESILEVLRIIKNN